MPQGFKQFLEQNLPGSNLGPLRSPSRYSGGVRNENNPGGFLPPSTFVPTRFGSSPGPVGQQNANALNAATLQLDLARTVSPFVQQAAPQILPQGFENLANIIAGQGATDPALLNRQLADISRGTQQQQDALRGQQAAFGMTSPAFGALSAAIGLGGAEQQAQLRAQDAQLAEERKRSDLVNLLLPLILGPGLGLDPNVGKSFGPSDFESALAAATGLVDAAIPG